jgi:hypothetical protein
MATQFAMKPLAVRPSRSSVVVRATAADARAWMNAWKSKSAGRPAAWYPGTTAPAYLKGTLPGDYGFDPLQLGKDADKLEWYVQAELQHARWAMLGVAGVLVPEIAFGAKWYETGDLTYWASPNTLFAIQVLLFSWVEWRRLQDMQKPGSVDSDPIFTNNKVVGTGVGYPGFDPLKLSRSSRVDLLKLNEIKNGRLAMLAFAGFAAQRITTGTTPLANLAAHVADPWNTTVVANDLSRLF